MTDKEITGYYGDGKGKFFILYKDGSRALAKFKKNNKNNNNLKTRASAGKS